MAIIVDVQYLPTSCWTQLESNGKLCVQYLLLLALPFFYRHCTLASAKHMSTDYHKESVRTWLCTTEQYSKDLSQLCAVWRLTKWTQYWHRTSNSSAVQMQITCAVQTSSTDIESARMLADTPVDTKPRRPHNELPTVWHLSALTVPIVGAVWESLVMHCLYSKNYTALVTLTLVGL